MRFGPSSLNTVLPGGVGFQRFSVWATEFKVLSGGKQMEVGEEDEEFIVEGLATSPKVDFTGDVLPTKALAEHLPEYQDNPLYTFCHNAMVPIGTTFDQELTRQGLRYKARIITDWGHEPARMARILITNGACRRSSIGYDSLKSHIETDNEGRRIRIHDEVRLHEIAAVPLAMNAATSVSFAKGLGLGDFAEDIEKYAALKRVSGAKNLPLAPETTPWRWNSQAQNEVLGDDDDWGRYAKVHFFVDPDAADTKAGYKLPFGKTIDGELKAVWRGVAAAAGAMLGARGGVKGIPENDRPGIWARIEHYYGRFEKDVPEHKGTPIGGMIAEGESLPAFGEIDWQADEKGILEEHDFEDYIGRVSGAAERFTNIARHWQEDPALWDEKASRVLSAANLDRLRDALVAIDKVIRAHTDRHGGGDDDEKGTPSLALSREDELALCRATGVVDPIAAILDGRLRVTQA